MQINLWKSTCANQPVQNVVFNNMDDKIFDIWFTDVETESILQSIPDFPRSLIQYALRGCTVSDMPLHSHSDKSYMDKIHTRVKRKTLIGPVRFPHLCHEAAIAD
ncbi:hypothetical protein STEG23_029314, partial [Scotinomys teguina]